MTTDPPVSARAYARVLGLPVHAIQAAVRCGHVPRAGRGRVPLLGTLAGLLGHVRAEAADLSSYACPAAPAACAATLTPLEARRRLDRHAARLDRLLMDLPGMPLRRVSSLSPDDVAALRVARIKLLARLRWHQSQACKVFGRPL
jgi:hypothetical protein